MANQPGDSGSTTYIPGRRPGFVGNPRILTPKDIANFLATHPDHAITPGGQFTNANPDDPYDPNYVDVGAATTWYNQKFGHPAGSIDEAVRAYSEFLRGGGGKGDGGDGDNGKDPVDWSSFIDIFGLPPDIIAEINRIFASTPDVTQATTRAMAYIRGTSWYAQTFPGINEARAKGLVVDERDYRRRVNDANTIYRQYLGRDMTTAEFLNDLNEGITLDIVARRFEGDAYVNANRNDIQYLAGNFADRSSDKQLTPDELKSYGRQQVGLGSMLGATLQSRLQRAQQRFVKVFQGVDASPALQLGGQGLNAPSLRANQLDRGDIAA